jgi:hypothetical protein
VITLGGGHRSSQAMGPGYPGGGGGGPAVGGVGGGAHQPLKLSGSFPLPKPSPSSHLPDQPEKQTIRNHAAS